MKVYCKANTKEILSTDPEAGPARARAVVLTDGTEIPANLVCDGRRHTTERQSRADAGLAINRGIVVGPDMRTSDPDISLGECAEAHGLVSPRRPLYEMANVVAAQLGGNFESAVPTPPRPPPSSR